MMGYEIYKLSRFGEDEELVHNYFFVADLRSLCGRLQKKFNACGLFLLMH